MKRLSLIVLIIFFASTAGADEITLMWDSNIDFPEGYRIYQASESGAHIFGEANSISGNIAHNEGTLTHQYSLFVPFGTFYFVATAYRGDAESSPSNEVIYVAQLPPDTTPPAQVQGVFIASIIPIPAELNVTNLFPSNYQIAHLNVGDTHYVDRIYTITAMPPELNDLLSIKTANDDKYNALAEFITFSINKDVILYIAYDSRATYYPDWLTNSYTNTEWIIDTEDVSLMVWEKEVAAGTVSLPGNHYGNPVGVDSNYIVLMKSR